MIITCLSYTNKKDFTKVKYEFNLELFLRVICLFVWGFSSHSKIFHSFEDVTITAWTVNFDLIYSALMANEQWGFFIVPHLLWHGPTLYNGHFRGLVTLTPVAEDLDRIEPRSPACEANILPQSHRDGSSFLKHIKI